MITMPPPRIHLKIMKYNKEHRTHTCMMNKNRYNIIEVDIIADSSFHNEYKDLNVDEFHIYMESWVGKEITCEDLGAMRYYSINSIKCVGLV